MKDFTIQPESTPQMGPTFAGDLDQATFSNDWRRAISPQKLLTWQQVVVNPEQVVAVLRSGGVVVAPTDTLYGLLVRASDQAALQKMFRLKGRSLEKQVPLLIEDPERMLPYWAKEIPEVAKKLMAEFWPGPLTLVMPAVEGLSRFLTGNGMAIGVRQSAHPTIRAIIQALGEAVTGTSANLTGGGAPFRPEQISQAILEKADLVIDGGPLHGMKGSTVLDLTGAAVRILRQGDLPLSRIQEVIAL